MAREPLDSLLDRLRAGDEAVAGQIVAEYEPYLRVVVRRCLPDQLRAKFDSLDVMQSVWVQVIRALRGRAWQVTDRAHLQALLVTVARRRLVSRYRHYRAAITLERRRGAGLESLPERREPQPSEVAEADELWQRMLALCPPEYHDLLRLRREGLRLREIAARTGMHEGSVRRILRRLARQMALGQDSFAPIGAAEGGA
jgi:RNA polymerase sigma-70 factor (ECF subfamily)